MSNPGFVANCVQVRLLWSDFVGRFMNVTHGIYTAAGPLNPGIAQSIMNALVADARTTAWLALMPTTASLVGVDVRDLRASNNPIIESSGPAVPGTAATTALPPQVAVAITLRTAFAGRAFRGRVFLGGLAAATADADGRINGGVNTAGVDLVTALSAAMLAQGATFAIMQRWLPERPGHGGITLPERQPNVVPVSTIVGRDNIFDTQRRRTGAHVGSR